MPLRFKCPNCTQTISARFARPGDSVECSACGRRGTVPAEAEKVPDPSPHDHGVQSVERTSAPARPVAPALCPSCKTELEPGAAFCAGCGLEMAKGHGIGRAQAHAHPSACRACGSPLAATDRQCGFCGTPVTSAA